MKRSSGFQSLFAGLCDFTGESSGAGREIKAGGGGKNASAGGGSCFTSEDGMIVDSDGEDRFAEERIRLATCS